MHIQGTPQTMQQEPSYENVVEDICTWLEQRRAVLVGTGIPDERLVFDPGIGFGKTAKHNVEVLSSIGTFRRLGRPVLIGHSRKRFLGKVIGRQVDERSSGTIGISIAVAQQGADIIRVHDVRSTRDALIAWHTVTRGGSACLD